jgi:hypothetical protein
VTGTTDTTGTTGTAGTLAVITPSYAPDLDLCGDLNASVLRYTPDDVRHYIITPARDVPLFSRLRGSRTEVLAVNDVLPRRIVTVPRANYWLNLRRPFPPIRGWMMQQLVKLQAASQLPAGRLLLVDSDVLLVRPVTAQTFVSAGRTRFYRRAAGVGGHMPRHLRWHDNARALLGLPLERSPLPDYISAFNVWDQATVRALQAHIQRLTGRNWIDVIAAELDFSEFILYGVFVDKVLGDRAQVQPAASMLCHSYWQPEPLNTAAADSFVRGLSSEDVAVMISAKSRTPLAVRRAALAVLH